MKQYIIALIGAINILTCMEQPKVRDACEWNAKDYDDTNIIQEPSFLDFLEQNKIILEKRKILSIGCGTGSMEHIMVTEKEAAYVKGIDASKNIIEYAQKTYGLTDKISFEHCFAEDFISSALYEVAVLSFSLHWIQDKQKALTNIYKALQPNGELFALLLTSNNPKPTSFTTALETMAYFQEMALSQPNKDFPHFNINDPSMITNCTYPSQEELNDILQKTGFNIIANRQETFTCTMDEADIRKIHWATFTSKPYTKDLSDNTMKTIFTEFIRRYKEKLSKNEEGRFIDKIYTTLIHARKTANVIKT